MLLETRQQRVYADYHQFYIADTSPFRFTKPAQFPGDPGEAALWNPQQFDDRMAAIPGMVAVSTGSYGHVQVKTEIHTSEPELKSDGWDHVSEGSLEMKTPDLMIIGCIDSGRGEVFTVTPGFYRVRCCHANLAGISDSGGGSDWYLVQIWLAPSAPIQVLKRAERPGPKAVVPPKPHVSIRSSDSGDTRLTFDENGLEAHGVTLRQLTAIAYGNSMEPEFPADLIIGPRLLDEGVYDVSASGKGWGFELRRTLAEQFGWRFQFVMRGNAPAARHYLAISDEAAEAEAQRQREESLRRHMR